MLLFLNSDKISCGDKNKLTTQLISLQVVFVYRQIKIVCTKLCYVHYW